MVTSSIDKLVRIWDEAGALTKAMKDHREIVYTARWNREGNIIATLSNDKKIIVSLHFKSLL